MILGQSLCLCHHRPISSSSAAPLPRMVSSGQRRMGSAWSTPQIPVPLFVMMVPSYSISWTAHAYLMEGPGRSIARCHPMESAFEQWTVPSKACRHPGPSLPASSDFPTGAFDSIIWLPLRISSGRARMRSTVRYHPTVSTFRRKESALQDPVHWLPTSSGRATPG